MESHDTFNEQEEEFLFQSEDPENDSEEEDEEDLGDIEDEDDFDDDDEDEDDFDDEDEENDGRRDTTNIIKLKGVMVLGAGNRRDMDDDY